VAQKVEVKLIDDLDGGQADETVAFSLDGAQYVIDLSGKNAKQLRGSLAKYIEAARREKGVRQTGRGGRRATAAAAGPDTSEVRNWAKGQGLRSLRARSRLQGVDHQVPGSPQLIRSTPAVSIAVFVAGPAFAESASDRDPRRRV
jgi:hypothetical protein